MKDKAAQTILARLSALRAEMKARMDALGVKPLALEKAAGLKESAVRNIFRDKANEPSVFKIADIAEALGCTVDDLVESGNRLRPELSPLHTDVVNPEADHSVHNRTVNSRREVRLTTREAKLVRAFRRLDPAIQEAKYIEILELGLDEDRPSKTAGLA